MFNCRHFKLTYFKGSEITFHGTIADSSFSLSVEVVALRHRMLCGEESRTPILTAVTHWLKRKLSSTGLLQLAINLGHNKPLSTSHKKKFKGFSSKTGLQNA